MKNLLIIIFASILFISCKSTYIYVVRHGEKASQPADNPHLTDEGNTRAKVLSELLSDKNITHVYSTNYHRTMETGFPTALKNNLQIELYSNDTTGKFVRKALNQNQNSLIVGHSNTVLTILDSFRVSHAVRRIADNDFDNLFVITIRNGKAKSVKEGTYGKVTE